MWEWSVLLDCFSPQHPCLRAHKAHLSTPLSGTQLVEPVSISLDASSAPHALSNQRKVNTCKDQGKQQTRRGREELDSENELTEEMR